MAEHATTTPAPKPIGLLICEQVIEDIRTRNVTVVSIFTDRVFQEFPTERTSLSLYCPLTDGAGTGTMVMEVYDAEEMDRIFSRQYRISIPDRMSVAHVHVRLNDVRFPEAGTYVFRLTIDGDFVADRLLNVRHSGV